MGIVHAKEVTAKALTQYLLDFLQEHGIPIQKLRGLGFDGASAMSGSKGGVQIQMRYHSPSALYVHCRCHQLQLAAVYAANEYNEVKKVFGTLLTMWKAFHYSPKKAEKLTEIQAVPEAPEIVVTKPSDTRWLARERCVCAVRKTLPALVTTFETIYEDSGDAEAYGLSKLLCTYKFVASLYMLCDILHTVAKLHGSLQSKEFNLATVPVMVCGTIKRLQELKEHPATSTWFKDLLKVVTETSQSSLQDVSVSEADKTSFLSRIYRPYIQSVIDHISSRMESSDFFLLSQYLIQFIYLILKNLYQLMVWRSCSPLLIFMERSRHCPLKVTLEFQSQMMILTKQKQNGKSFVGFFSSSIDLNQGFRR